MRNKFGILCMLLGAAMVLCALYLVVHNEQENLEAEVFTENILPLIRDEISIAQQTDPTEQTTPQDTGPGEFPSSDDLILPEDLIMTEKVINGYSYIGYLTIPELNLELPIMSGWDSRRLQISPCRFTGTLKGKDLVIMAHNYQSHFGRLSKLSEDSAVQFTDMDGNVWHFTVAAMDILPAEAVEEMTAGEYDLTLFTCAPNRSQRLTVRCNRLDS